MEYCIALAAVLPILFFMILFMSESKAIDIKEHATFRYREQNKFFTNELWQILSSISFLEAKLC